MPRGDRTGPMGVGPMTGRAARGCAIGTTFVPGRGAGMNFTNASYGARGRGPCGRGLGRRNMNHFTGRYGAPLQTSDSETERQAQKNRAETLRAELDSIDKRLKALENANAAR